jgi:uncharacterized protein (UPF0335 family)
MEAHKTLTKSFLPFLHKISRTKLEMEDIRQTLKSYHEVFANIESTENDLNSMEEIVETKLQSSECYAKDPLECKLAGLKIIMPLLNSTEYSIGQKSVLYKMLNSFVNP